MSKFNSNSKCKKLWKEDMTKKFTKSSPRILVLILDDSIKFDFIIPYTTFLINNSMIANYLVKILQTNLQSLPTKVDYVKLWEQNN